MTIQQATSILRADGISSAEISAFVACMKDAAADPFFTFTVNELYDEFHEFQEWEQMA